MNPVLIPPLTSHVLLTWPWFPPLKNLDYNTSLDYATIATIATANNEEINGGLIQYGDLSEQ